MRTKEQINAELDFFLSSASSIADPEREILEWLAATWTSSEKDSDAQEGESEPEESIN